MGRREVWYSDARGVRRVQNAKGREGGAKDVCSSSTNHYPSRCIVCTKSLAGQHRLSTMLRSISTSHQPTHARLGKAETSGDSPSHNKRQE